MRQATMIAIGVASLAAAMSCGRTPQSNPSAAPSEAARAVAGVDTQLASVIAAIRAVDNHTHVNSTAPNDTEFDALPIDGLPPFDLPARGRPDNPEWVTALRSLYDYPHNDMSETHLADLRQARARIVKAQGDKFPAWVLDKIGTEVMLANRVAMGPGLEPPRFRWVSFADSLMLPLSNAIELAVTPDRAVLYPLADKLRQRYWSDLRVAKAPATLDEYQRKVVSATLERQRQAGCVAVKFEAAYLRSLDFADSSFDDASRVYTRYAGGGQPSRADYKTLQDYLLRYIAREAGRLGMAVHIHSFEAAGGFFAAAGADPLLLEPAFNDPSLRKTNFVIVHGGGVFAAHAGAMLAKPNVYLDFSLMELLYTVPAVADALRGWLTQYPDKVMFGTDASPFGPDLGWEVAASLGSTSARTALGMALTTMVRNNEVSRDRAEQIARMVMRGTASKLYNLSLP